MKIIISPAKTMREDGETLPARSLPVFEAEAERVLRYLRSLRYEEQKELWACSDKLCELNRGRLLAMDWLDGQAAEQAENGDASQATALPTTAPIAAGASRGSGLPLSQRTPALLAYEGIQYQYLSPATLDEAALRYLETHLRILSGVYGVLRPFDGVVPYRLEMQAKAKIGSAKDLYAFWGGRLLEALREDCRQTVIINLASKEYAHAVEPYLSPEVTFVTCIFAESVKGKLRQKATAAKMARGEMVRWMAETGAETVEALKKFDRLDYRFEAEQSGPTQLVFVRRTE